MEGEKINPPRKINSIGKIIKMLRNQNSSDKKFVYLGYLEDIIQMQSAFCGLSYFVADDVIPPTFITSYLSDNAANKFKTIKLNSDKKKVLDQEYDRLVQKYSKPKFCNSDSDGNDDKRRNPLSIRQVLSLFVSSMISCTFAILCFVVELLLKWKGQCRFNFVEM